MNQIKIFDIGYKNELIIKKKVNTKMVSQVK